MVPDSPHAEDTSDRPDGAGPEPADLAVEPVEDATCAATGAVRRRSPAATRERLHRLVLEARVASLEAQLERKDRELATVIRQYEAVLERRPGTEGDLVGTWRDGS